MWNLKMIVSESQIMYMNETLPRLLFFFSLLCRCVLVSSNTPEAQGRSMEHHGEGTVCVLSVLRSLPHPPFLCSVSLEMTLEGCISMCPWWDSSYWVEVGDEAEDSKIQGMPPSSPTQAVSLAVSPLWSVNTSISFCFPPDDPDLGLWQHQLLCPCSLGGEWFPLWLLSGVSLPTLASQLFLL